MSCGDYYSALWFLLDYVFLYLFHYRRLVNNQVAISEKEREIVFKEYEKQMVAVENR